MWQRQISKYRLYMELHDGNFNFQSPWGVDVSPCTQVQATSLKSTGFSSAFYKWSKQNVMIYSYLKPVQYALEIVHIVHVEYALIIKSCFDYWKKTEYTYSIIHNSVQWQYHNTTIIMFTNCSWKQNIFYITSEIHLNQTCKIIFVYTLKLWYKASTNAISNDCYMSSLFFTF